jgi:REP element-mobilizing transposase RayT
MPRGARLDAPGTLHHVMVRGIEAGRIIIDDVDRESFVSRIAAVASRTGTHIYAWALMTNHVHLLLKSGPAGLPDFMRKLLTGYSITYNKRHQRHGHLFQNRYKSIVCEEEPYLRKLVAYIHLNPLRAGLVGSLDELSHYQWCGHAALMRHTTHEWQELDYVLGYFGQTEDSARKAYLNFIHDQLKLGKQHELTGGGLIRSAGGWFEVFSMRQRGERQFSDERILGGGDFVKALLDEAEPKEQAFLPISSRMAKAQEELESRCGMAGISLESLQSGSRRVRCSIVRKELALRFVLELGLSFAETARLIGISASGVNQIVRRMK